LAPLRKPRELGGLPHYVQWHLEENYLEGIPQSTHEDEWGYYFEKPIVNSGNPQDPRYWRELDRQVRVKFPNPDPRIEQRVKAVARISEATQE